MIILALERLKMYKRPSEDSFTLKKSKSNAMLGTPKTFIPEDDQQPDQNASKVRRKLGWTDVKMLQNAFDKRI